MPNRLGAESSPYLRQHADNPVDWYPWGAEAFTQAATQDKPILLSVGYAACHWCHVMAHESFEDAETAALMNALFINVKVDREERPDVDSIYMQAVQAMVGQGGWPMTVALTPSGDPYWGGTYFPLVDRPGIPSFKRVLHALSEAWQTRRESVDRTAGAMRDLYANAAATSNPSGQVSPELLERAFAGLKRQYDTRLGGFGSAPKFPQTMALDFCLRWWSRGGDAAARDIAHRSFIAMARGGIYDQVGGGFHRYSVDAEWLVPHFEKMLYDNALLIRLGTHLWQVTQDSEVARIVDECISWTLKEMTSAEGGFYASLDADSEGHEGIFYVWTSDEFNAALGEEAAAMRALWGVSEGGNFESRNILHLGKSRAAIAQQLGKTDAEFDEIVKRSIATLYNLRSQREWPSRDDKILAGWNGLMLRALAEAGRVFGRADWTDAALKNARFLRATMVHDGRLMRVHMDGVTKVPGFLEDHAAVALAFLSVQEATGDASWIDEARTIAVSMREQFRDPATGAWYDTAADAEPLITRPHDEFDNAVPSGSSLAQELMLRLAEIDGSTDWATEVVQRLAVQAEPMTRWPQGFGHLLGVTDLALFGAIAVALVGERSADDFQALMDVVANRYVPTLVLVSGRSAVDSVP
ncbi:MAG: thioredoxin domain-containing protein, partial [Phycisphaerae bacterium]|nr:thioredoxin domain-containing protein [Gemmatimonadaceae bacterium]